MSGSVIDVMNQSEEDKNPCPDILILCDMLSIKMKLEMRIGMLG